MSSSPATGPSAELIRYTHGSTRIGRTCTPCVTPMFPATRGSAHRPRTARIGCLACTHGNSSASPEEASATGRPGSDRARSRSTSWRPPMPPAPVADRRAGVVHAGRHARFRRRAHSPALLRCTRSGAHRNRSGYGCTRTACGAEWSRGSGRRVVLFRSGGRRSPRTSRGASLSAEHPQTYRSQARTWGTVSPPPPRIVPAGRILEGLRQTASSMSFASHL